MFWELLRTDTTFALYMLLLAVAILMMIAGFRVRSVFNRHSKQMARSGMTADEAARQILYEAGVTDVRIEGCRGHLTDHYDPRDNTVYLSEGVYGNRSIASLGVAAHEVGHAIQHAEGYAPVRLRTALVPVMNIANRLMFPMILLGLIVDLMQLTTLATLFLWIGIGGYAMYTFFLLVTLPVELNASHRALAALGDTRILAREEIPPTRRVLSAAAMTYLLSFAYSLLQLLRLIAIFGRRRD